MRRLLLFFLAGCILTGCWKRSYDSYEKQQYYEDDFAYAEENDAGYYGEGYMLEQSAQSYGAVAARSAVQKEGKQGAYTKYKVSEKNNAKKGDGQNQEQTMARMVHYNGYVNLNVARPEETVEEIVTLAEKYKGNIERRSTQSITIRVPKDSFTSAFNAILSLGDVLNKSVTSEDVSEAFTSVELRLKTAQTTRDRLLALLEKASDEEEKIKILRQLQRLNEQIDVIEAQMRTLQSLADYSSISVDLTARKAVADGTQQIEAAGFAWIHDLSPFQSSVCHSGKRLELETPNEFVSLHPKGSYIAESADGTVLRATRLPNNPRGSSVFWREAIQERLASGFGKVESKQIGQFESIFLHEDSDNPYIWIIAVHDAGKYIELVEVYFPNSEQFKRHTDSALTAITGGAQ